MLGLFEGISDGIRERDGTSEGNVLGLFDKEGFKLTVGVPEGKSEGTHDMEGRNEGESDGTSLGTMLGASL